MEDGRAGLVEVAERSRDGAWQGSRAVATRVPFRLFLKSKRRFSTPIGYPHWGMLDTGRAALLDGSHACMGDRDILEAVWPRAEVMRGHATKPAQDRRRRRTNVSPS